MGVGANRFLNGYFGVTHLESQSFLSVTWNKSSLERDGNGTAKVNIADQNRLGKIDFLHANMLLVDDEGT